MPIAPGWVVEDDNLLATSEAHIRQVFAMLGTQPKRPQLAGGLEAARLQPWHIEFLRALRPKQVFFAYDGPQDLEPLRAAGAMLQAAGFTFRSRTLRCYVLIGHPRDTLHAAETRLRQTVEAGFWPFAMLYRDHTGRRAPDWIHFAKLWSRPATIAALLRRRETPDATW